MALSFLNNFKASGAAGGNATLEGQINGYISEMENILTKGF